MDFRKSMSFVNASAPSIRLAWEDVFRIMSEAIADYAVFIVDADGVVVTWNGGAQKINGYTQEEIIGRHFSIFYPADNMTDCMVNEQLDIAAGSGHYETEGWRVRRDRSRFWANVNITALRDNEDELVGLVVITRDLTERRKAQRNEEMVDEERKAAELKALRAMSGAIALEMCKPLATMHAVACQLDRVPNSTLEGQLEMVSYARERLLQQIEVASRDLKNLRSFACDGCYDLVEPVFVTESIHEATELQRTRYEKEGIALLVKGPTYLPPVYGRTVQISQVISTLLNRSFDAVLLTQTKSRWVSVNTSLEKGCIQVEVTDSGPLLTNAEQLWLVEPRFHQTEFKSGIALAMSIARAIAQDHKGLLTFRLNRGCNCFRLTLPNLTESSPTKASVVAFSSSRKPIKKTPRASRASAVSNTRGC